MKNLVIVGAGPNGLIFACLLKMSGHDVIVIDPRTGPYNKKMTKGDDPTAGTYTRPTYLSEDLFNLVQNLLNITFPSEVLENFQMKNLERTLYDHAKNNLKIDIRKASFVSLAKKGIVIKDTVSNKVEYLPTYLVVDATGDQRALVNALNKIAHNNPKFKTKPFDIRRIAVNPVKNHFIANVILNNPDNVKTIKDYSKTFFDYPDMVTGPKEATNYLKSKYGWTSKAPPYFKPVVYNEKTGKVIFHFETTDNLQPEQHDDFLKALIWWKLDIENISFDKIETRKFKKKPQFMPFVVDPHEVVPGYYSSQQKGPEHHATEGEVKRVIPEASPDALSIDAKDQHEKSGDTVTENLAPEDISDIVVVGDALSQTDHRLSIAITNAIDRMVLLLFCSSKNKDGTITVDFKKYQEKLSEYNEESNAKLSKFYAERKEQLSEKLEGPNISPYAIYTEPKQAGLFTFETIIKKIPQPTAKHASHNRVRPTAYKTKKEKTENSVQFNYNNVTFTIKKSSDGEDQTILVFIGYTKNNINEFIVLELKDIENRIDDLLKASLTDIDDESANSIKGGKKILLEYILKLLRNEEAWLIHSTPRFMRETADIINDALEYGVTKEQTPAIIEKSINQYCQEEKPVKSTLFNVINHSTAKTKEDHAPEAQVESKLSQIKKT